MLRVPVSWKVQRHDAPSVVCEARAQHVEGRGVIHPTVQAEKVTARARTQCGLPRLARELISDYVASRRSAGRAPAPYGPAGRTGALQSHVQYPVLTSTRTG